MGGCGIHVAGSQGVRACPESFAVRRNVIPRTRQDGGAEVANGRPWPKGPLPSVTERWRHEPHWNNSAIRRPAVDLGSACRKKSQAGFDVRNGARRRGCFLSAPPGPTGRRLAGDRTLADRTFSHRVGLPPHDHAAMRAWPVRRPGTEQRANRHPSRSAPEIGVPPCGKPRCDAALPRSAPHPTYSRFPRWKSEVRSRCGL